MKKKGEADKDPILCTKPINEEDKTQVNPKPPTSDNEESTAMVSFI